eukprot:TRINITY_DN1815_c0_g3_i1.p1 TRINITY_DN1815_c0_g3~~TRINITY_DN1815_c0_g3_i1.p1  ORF type:complete len:445 (+),score=201.85 TRINITY_DN1815_c0_g3_i1:123-1457(+)
MAATSNPLVAAANAVPFSNPKRTFVQSRYSQLDTKSVVAAEQKIELADLLQEAMIELKGIYRSKFVFGEYLKHVDGNFNSDGAQDFNVATPAPFEASYVGGRRKEDENKPAEAGQETAKEKLRTAEELIKKLYRRNSLLEVENKYFKSEVGRKDKLIKEKSHGQPQEVGQIPVKSTMSKKYVRRNRSTPPTRLILRTAQGGTESKREKKEKEPDDASKEANGVTMLKQKIVTLTEALVACQHENNRLSKERHHRVSLRDSILKKYLVERDNAIAQLHMLLTEVSEKVQNPLRLTRVKQPAATVNPVVAGNNMLKEISGKLTDQISSTTQHLLQGGDAREEALLKGAMPSQERDSQSIAGKRRELMRRTKQLVDGLPVSKKKQMLHLMNEIKQMNRSLQVSNGTVLQAYEDLKVQLNSDLVQEKLQVALLKDKVRAFGGQDEELT